MELSNEDGDRATISDQEQPDATPPVMGGQGRSDEETTNMAWMLSILAFSALAGILWLAVLGALCIAS